MDLKKVLQNIKNLLTKYLRYVKIKKKQGARNEN